MAAYGNMEKAVPGLLDGLNHQIDSRLADGAIEFGDVVCGKDGDQVFVGGDTPLGIVARTALDAPDYPNKAAVNVARTGKIWANASEAITADSEVSVNASTGKIIAKTSAAAGAKRVVTITAAGTSAADKKVVVNVGDKKVEVDTTADCKSANGVAAAIQAGLAALDIPFVATVSSAVVTLTAKGKGVDTNDVAITAATSDSTQTLTVAQTTAGSDVVANPGWFARSTIDAPGIVLVDMN